MQLDENWNQLQVNEEKFKIKTDYKEEDYTTQLDMNQIDNRTKQKLDGFYKVPEPYLSILLTIISLGNHEQDCKHKAPERGT